MRGDDSHVAIDGDGHMRADDVSLFDHVVDTVDFMLDTGRPMPIGVAQGTVYAAVVPERIPVKLGIVADVARVLRGLDGTAALARSRFARRVPRRRRRVRACRCSSERPTIRCSGTTPRRSSVCSSCCLVSSRTSRYLNTRSRWWYAASIAAVLILVFTYEANPPLVLAFAALHLGRHPWRLSSWKPVFPILAIGAAVTLLSAYMHRSCDVRRRGLSGVARPDPRSSDGRSPGRVGDPRHLLRVRLAGTPRRIRRGPSSSPRSGVQVSRPRSSSSRSCGLRRPALARAPQMLASQSTAGGTSAVALQIGRDRRRDDDLLGPLHLAGQAASAAHLPRWRPSCDLRRHDRVRALGGRGLA